MFQSTNEYTEKAVTQNLGDVVINQHLDICVKLCLTDIWVIKAKATWRLNNVSSVFQFLIYL